MATPEAFVHPGQSRFLTLSSSAQQTIVVHRYMFKKDNVAYKLLSKTLLASYSSNVAEVEDDICLGYTAASSLCRCVGV